MQVRRQLTGDRTDLLGASVAETALLLQSIRHEIVRCERRAADALLGQSTKELEQHSLKVLKSMSYHLNALFVDKTAAE